GQEITVHPNLSTSTLTELHVPVPTSIILGSATISVTRPGYARVLPTGSSIPEWQSRDLVSNRASLSLAARRNQYVFVANAASQDVGIINGDPRSPGFNEVIAKIPTPPTSGETPGGYPWRVAVTPDGTRAYVTRRYGGDISVIDALAFQELDLDPATTAL